MVNSFIHSNMRGIWKLSKIYKRMDMFSQIKSFSQQSRRLINSLPNLGIPRSYARFFVSIGITAVFLYLLLHNLDREAFMATLSKISVPNLLIAFIFLCIDYLVRIVRWWLMLREIEPKLAIRTCIWPYIVSVAINDIAPFRAGDAFRAFGFRKQLQTPSFRIIGTLVIERALDLITLLGFFFITFTMVPKGNISYRLIKSATWVALFVLITALMALLFPKQLYAILKGILNAKIFRRFNLDNRLLGYMDHVLVPLRLLRSHQFTLKMVGITTAIWLLEGAIFITIAEGLHALPSIIAPLFSMAIGTLGTLLPSSPGYFGTFDYCAMYGIVAYGTGRNTATAFALIVHFILWFPLVMAGVIYYLLSSLSAIPTPNENEEGS